MAYWFVQQREAGGFPIERAEVGNCELSVLFVGGEWQWLVRRGRHNLAEGVARASRAARQQAEAMAHRINAAAMPQAA